MYSKLRRVYQNIRGDCMINNTCECCGKEVDTVVQDHDHFNGLNRGKICLSCNRVLTETLQKNQQQYITYLERWELDHVQLMSQGYITQGHYYKNKVQNTYVKESIGNRTLFQWKDNIAVSQDESRVIPLDELLTRRFT